MYSPIGRVLSLMLLVFALMEDGKMSTEELRAVVENVRTTAPSARTHSRFNGITKSSLCDQKLLCICTVGGTWIIGANHI